MAIAELTPIASQPLEAFDPLNPAGQYFKEINQYPLLTREDEVDLAKKIENGRKARSTLSHIQDSSSRLRLEEKIRTGDEAFDKLVQSNLRLVVSRAKKQLNHKVPFLDLIQEGNLGLMHAIRKFDWRKGFKFSTYAVFWIDHYIARALQNQPDGARIPVWAHEKNTQISKAEARLDQELGRSPTLEELKNATGIQKEKIAYIKDLFEPVISLDRPLHEDDDSLLSETIASVEKGTDELAFVTVNYEMAVELLREAVPVISKEHKERDFDIVVRRFLGDDEETLDKIGQEYGLTRERVRQIQRKIREALRKGQTASHVALAQFIREGIN